LTAASFLLTRAGVVKLVGIGEPPWLHPGSSDREASVEEDLRSLGQVALGWMQAGSRRRGFKPRPFPTGLLEVLRGLGAAPDDGGVPHAVYPTAAALLEDLDRAAREVPGDHGAWEKVLTFVDANGGDDVVRRQSA
jgi:hypothetical protein